MPSFEITSPDGRKFRVDGPDGSTQDDALAQVKAQMSAAPQSFGERVAAKLPQVMPMGGYELDALMGGKQMWDKAAQMASRATGLGVQDTENANAWTKRMYEATQPQNRPGADLMRGALPGVALSRVLPGASGVLSGAGSGAAGGAIGGALTPVYDAKDDADFWQKTRQQTVQGAVLGGGLGGAAPALAKAISPSLDAAQAALAAAGIRMTPGQSSGGILKGLEDRAAGFPVVGDLIKGARNTGVQDFNRATYARALSEFGDEGAQIAKSAPVGHEGIAKVGNYLSAKYEDALSRSVPSTLDPQFQSGINKIAGMVPQSMRDDFLNAIRNNVTVTPAGTLTPSVAKAADSGLKQLASTYSGSSVGGERVLGGALNQAAAEVRKLMARYNPQTAADIAKADSGWATLAQLERAGSMLGAKEGVFTPTQLLNAIKTGDRSVRDRKFARGEMLNQDLAEAAKNVLPSSVNDSGTAGREALAAAVGMGPSGLLGFFGNPLSAMATGAAVLPYMPGIGPLINAARLSPGAQSISDLLRRAAPGLGLLGTSASAP